MSSGKELLERIDPKIATSKGFVAGDIVTTYNKGYHRVLGFFDIDYGNHPVGARGVATQAVYESILSQHFTKVGKTIRSCHVEFLRIAEPLELIKELNTAIATVKETFGIGNNS